MQSLKKRTIEYKYRALANSVIDHLETLDKKNVKSLSSNLNLVFNEIEEFLHWDKLDQSSPGCTDINRMFEKLIEFIPSFEPEYFGRLTKLCHYLESNFEQQSDNVGPRIKRFRAFEPSLLFKLFDSDRIPEKHHDLFIQQTLVSRINSAVDLNSFQLKNEHFKDFEQADKHRILTRMVEANELSSLSNRWVLTNLCFIVDIVCNEKHYSLGTTMFLNTLGTKNDDVRIFKYTNSQNGHANKNQKNIDNVDKLRTFMCGGIDKYNTMLKAAESLGLAKDSNYWLSVLNKDISHSMCTDVVFECSV